VKLKSLKIRELPPPVRGRRIDGYSIQGTIVGSDPISIETQEFSVDSYDFKKVEMISTIYENELWSQIFYAKEVYVGGKLFAEERKITMV
jgi:hypothetical protein